MPVDAKSVQALLDQIHWLSADLKRRAASTNLEEQNLLLAARGALQALAQHGDLSVPAVADVRNTTRQNIQIIANRLAEQGLIQFVPNPRHKKSDLLHLTEKGSALLASTGVQEAAFLDNLAAHLRKSEVDSAMSCLSHLRSVLSSSVQAQPAPLAQKARGAARALPPSSPAPAPVISEPLPVQIPKSYSEEESLPVNLL